MDKIDAAIGIVCLVIAALLFWWGASSAPSPQEASAHADVDAARQVQLQHERNRRYTAVRRADSLARLLRDCRMERAKLEATR